MAKRRRFLNMYLTTTISVSLVLFLIGLECVLMLSMQSLFKRVKEDVVVTVLLDKDADSTAVRRMNALLAVSPYCHHYEYVSAEQALQEHIIYLGEDPTQFLGYNPLSNSYEVYLREQYVCQDSMAVVAEQLRALPYVNKVSYQRDLMDLMNTNFNDISMLLLLFALVLLLIAEALIINTIRLQIYSKRFLIRTMDLVGATSWMIKKPFVVKNMWLGTIAATLALMVLAGCVYYVHYRMGIVLFDYTWQNLGIIALVVYGFGICITFITSMITCDRYIRMKEDTVYSI